MSPDFETHETGTQRVLSEKDLEIANLKALVRESVEVVEDLMPGIPHIVCDFGKLNDFLMASKEYTK